MNFGLNAAPALLVFLLPAVVWLVALYLILRFLRAFERAAYAHERIADALARPHAGPSDRGSMSAPSNER